MNDLTREIDKLNEKINVLTTDLDNAFRFNTPQRLTCKLEQETLSRTIPRLNEYGVKIEDKKVSFIDKSIVAKKVCHNCAGRYTCRAFQVFYSM